jgi:PAS domain S-box-containing protein
VKLLAKIKNSLSQDRLQISLFASWFLLALLFIIYAASAWFTSNNQIFVQLDALNQLVSKNTQQQARHLFLQLEQLNQQLLSAENSQHKLAPYFTNKKKNNSFDDSFLIDREGKFALSSFRHNNSLRLDLDKTIVAQTIIEKIQQSNKPSFIPTFSLGPGSSSQYVTICMPTQLINARLLCLALSTENEKLNWNRINDINDTAIRIIGAGNRLLYSDPLPMQKRSLLGEKVPSQVMSPGLPVQQVRDTGHSHFQQQLGIDGIKRMGSIQYLAEFDMFVVISIPTTHAITKWIELVTGPLLMLVLFCIISFLGYRLASYNFNLAKADYLITESALREQEGTLSLLFSNLPGMIYRVRIPDYKVLFITDGCQDLLGYSANSYLSGQRTPFDDIHADDQDILIKHADSIKNPKKKYEHIFRIKTPNGELKWLMDRGCSIRKDKNHVYLEGILLDITEHMISQQQVEYLATRDPLTELANRYLFNDELVNHIDRFRDKTSIALLFIDLDRFKTINDSLGHQVGDRLLKLVAERLQECIDDSTLLARLGGMNL